jgi:hypothetical protein
MAVITIMVVAAVTPDLVLVMMVGAIGTTPPIGAKMTLMTLMTMATTTHDNDNNDYYYDEPLTPIAPPSTPAPYEPPGYDFGGGNDPDPVTYPAPPPDPILPDDPRGYPDVYDPTPFEGPATDDDLGLTDAPISDYYNTEDPYEPNLLDPQTDDDLGFEDTLDTTDIFGPDADLIQDPVTGYVRPMTTQEIEQGALETRLSYAAPDNVLNQDIGDLSSATFDTGATITGTSPTDTANDYNFDNIAGVDPFTDTTDFNIGGDPIDWWF